MVCFSVWALYRNFMWISNILQLYLVHSTYDRFLCTRATMSCFGWSPLYPASNRLSIFPCCMTHKKLVLGIAGKLLSLQEWFTEFLLRPKCRNDWEKEKRLTTSSLQLLIFLDCWLIRVGLVQLGASRVHTKRSGVLLSAHLACALLKHFASQVRTLSILQLAPFPSAQVGQKTQHLCPTCALCFLHWHHTCCFCGAFYRQLSLVSDLTIFVLPINNTTVSKSI